MKSPWFFVIFFGSTIVVVGTYYTYLLHIVCNSSIVLWSSWLAAQQNEAIIIKLAR